MVGQGKQGACVIAAQMVLLDSWTLYAVPVHELFDVQSRAAVNCVCVKVHCRFMYYVHWVVHVLLPNHPNGSRRATSTEQVTAVPRMIKAAHTIMHVLKLHCTLLTEFTS